MATHKRLSIVVDGTVAMEAYWRSIVFSYLENIVRSFFYQSVRKGPAEGSVELGMIVYGARENTYPVRVTNWTTNLEVFVNALSKITFNADGGATQEPAIAEGLAGALLMFTKPGYGRPPREHYACERYCILVAATCPLPLPSPLLVPRMQEPRVCTDHKAEWRMVDVMELAQMFPQYDVSLSVMAPNPLPLLREVFIKGNHITEVSNIGVARFDNGDQLLLLLTDKFLEACNAVKHVHTYTSTKGAEANLQGCQNSGKRPMEPNPAWSVPNYEGASSSKTPSNPNDMSIYEDIVAELDAGLVVLSPSMPVTRGNLFEELKKLRAELDLTDAGRKQTEAVSEMSMLQRTKTMDPKSIARSRRHALQKNKRLAKQASMRAIMKSEKRTDHLRRVKRFRSLSMIAPVYNAIQRPFTTMASRVVMNASATGDSRMVVSRSASSLSRRFGTQQCSAYASSSSAMVPTDTRAESSSMGSKRTGTNASGELSIQTNANTDIAMVDISDDDDDDDDDDDNDDDDDDDGPPPPAVMPAPRESHVLTWRGCISAIYKGQVILICTAKAYRNISSRPTLTDDWPLTIQVRKIRRQNDIKDKIIANHWRAHYLILELTSRQELIHEKLISRELCAKVMFPSKQVMYIVPTRGIQRFIGILYDVNI